MSHKPAEPESIDLAQLATVTGGRLFGGGGGGLFGGGGLLGGGGLFNGGLLQRFGQNCPGGNCGAAAAPATGG